MCLGCVASGRVDRILRVRWEGHGWIGHQVRLGGKGYVGQSVGQLGRAGMGKRGWGRT